MLWPWASSFGFLIRGSAVARRRRWWLQLGPLRVQLLRAKLHHILGRSGMVGDRVNNRDWAHVIGWSVMDHAYKRAMVEWMSLRSPCPSDVLALVTCAA